MRSLRWLVLGVLLAGCEQELTVPGHCPEFCPSGQPKVFEIVLPATASSDSSFFGYLGHSEVPALLVSDGLPAGEARSWYRFFSVPDSIRVQDTLRPYTVDSIAIILTLIARDSTKKGLVFDLYRIPVTTDTTTSFEALNGELTPASWIDSMPVPDSVQRGSVRRVFTGESLDRFVIPPSDSGKHALGIRVRGPGPTGARISSLASSTGTASFVTYARVAVADTTLQKHTLSQTPEAAGFVRTSNGGQDPDLLYVGDLPAARTILRFELPTVVRDSGTLLRVTLELQPARPMAGLANDAASLEVRGVGKDLGAKSTPLFARVGVVDLPEGSSATVSVDVIGIVDLWTLPQPPASMLYLGLRPEGGSFHRPVFHSTRSGGGVPQLRITYLVPAPLEKP